MSTQNATQETKTKKAPKPKSALSTEIARVAKATGLPPSFIAKKIAAEKKKVNEAHQAALNGLAKRVAQIVKDAIAEIK
jgi:hypothetical protein